MTRKTKYPDNVIPVNFKKKPDNPDMKSLYPDAFAMYVDTKSDHPDDFSKAVLETLKQEKKGNHMLIAVIGGKLQGVEAVYLAQKAGWKTLVIDKNPEAPATGLCDMFLKFEFSPEHPEPLECPEVDFILPAIEDTQVLTAVKTWAKTRNIPLAFDLDAYRVSTSKLKSHALFEKLGLQSPQSWPGCSFPVVVKPDQASGSQGVEIIDDPTTLFHKFPNQQERDKLVIQEYMNGPSFSIEVVGVPGNYQALQVTDLGMDSEYDCNRITAPSALPLDQIRQFETTALTIAEEIGLNGIMDVEVIRHKNTLKLLEIDARLPSQTPMTVYWSTGINMVELLGNLILDKPAADTKKEQDRTVLVEHIRVSGLTIEFLGEHIMAGDGPLTRQSGFFGADEAITSFTPGKEQWVATLIFTGETADAVASKKRNCYEQIIKSAKPS